MSKARIMGAGSSGYNYGVNKNSPGNGNGKWQGLWPSVGHARNARLINTRAGGDNRNVVFCMNQLGGVGKISNMFATTADGVQDCKNGCILPSNIKHALQQLTNYAGKRGLLLGLAGVKETVQSDLPNTSGLTPFDTSFPPEMQQYVSLINGLGLKFQVTTPNDVQRHVVVMLTKADADALKAGGYGVPTLCDNIIAYGRKCPYLSVWTPTTLPGAHPPEGTLELYLEYPKSGKLTMDDGYYSTFAYPPTIVITGSFAAEGWPSSMPPLFNTDFSSYKVFRQSKDASSSSSLDSTWTYYGEYNWSLFNADGTNVLTIYDSKWSPKKQEIKDRWFYKLVFSSKIFRDDALTALPDLPKKYLTVVINNKEVFGTNLNFCNCSRSTNDPPDC